MPWEGFSLFVDLNYWFGPFFCWSRDNWWGSCWSDGPEKEVLSFFGNLLLCLLDLPSRMCRQMSKLSIIVRLALQMSDWLFKCQTGSSVYCHDFFRNFAFQPIGWLNPLMSGSEGRAGFSSGVFFPRVVQASPPCGVTFVSPHVCRAWLMKIRGRVFLRFLKIDSE